MNNNKVRNIYYMLCYVFFEERMLDLDEGKFSTEDFDNLYDFYTFLIIFLLDRVIKKGTYKNYVRKTEEVNRIKGRIEFCDSIRKCSLFRCKPICTYEEYSNNNLINQIIVSTLNVLTKTKIKKSYKIVLNRFKSYYYDVDTINPKNIRWNSIKYDRNNRIYEFIIYLCKMILDGVIISGYDGKNLFKNFGDNQAYEDLFERFIRAYVRKNYRQFAVKADSLEYNEFETYMFVPSMKTDISIIDERNMNVFVIDAKFKETILDNSKGNYYTKEEKKVYKREDIFQINAYVENYKKVKTLNGKHFNDVHGLLLYALTPEDKYFDSEYMSLNGNQIAVKTLDMTGNWNSIESKLKSIIDDFANNTFKSEV